MLDRSKGATALYVQIEQILKEQIENGEYAFGDILPSEKQLMEHFGVSRMTLRQAVGALTNQGYVQCARGIGTTVTFQKINERIHKVISFSEELRGHGIEMRTDSCEIGRVSANRSVAAALQIREGDPVYRLIRLRSAAGTPMVYSFTFLLDALQLSMDPVHYEASLYNYLETEKGICIAGAMDTFEAAVAAADVAAALQLSKGSPVFKRRRVARDQAQRIVEYTVCYYPGEKYKYTVEL